jgi:hypothetical protein
VDFVVDVPKNWNIPLKNLTDIIIDFVMTD